MNSKPNVVIIGAGVVGLCTAYELALKGARVTLIDSGSADAVRASSLNAGMIVPSHFTPMAVPAMLKTAGQLLFARNRPLSLSFRANPKLLDWYFKFLFSCLKKDVDLREKVLAALHLSSRMRYLEIESELDGAFQITQNGLFNFCKSPKVLEEEQATVRRASELGIRAEIVDQAEIKRREPRLSFEVAGGVHHLDDCHFDPELFMAAMHRRLQKLGVEVQWETRFLHATLRGDLVESMTTSSSTISADAFVIAAGAWSGQVCRKFNLKLPMMAGKGYSFKIPGLEHEMKACCLLHEGRVAITPMAGGMRFAGRMEIEVPELASSNSHQARAVAAIKKSAAVFLPQFEAFMGGNETVSAGLRPLSPDGMPYIGKGGSLSNLWVGSGHGMMGMSLGPVTGTLLASMIQGESPEINAARIPELEGIATNNAFQILSPSRFSHSSPKY